MPPQIASLPREGRGYPVTAEVPWTLTGPRLSDMDPHRTAALGFGRACAVCGFPLAAGRPVWRNLSQRDAANARAFDRHLTIDPGMAGHLSCMIYSAFACPYWASPAGRLRKDSDVLPGAPRGSRPAILGFEDIRMLISTDTSRPILAGPDSDATNVLFGYVELVADLPFKDPEDVGEQYATALEEDLAHLDLTGERFAWSDSADDMQRMEAVLDAGFAALHAATPVDKISYNGEDRMAFALPLR